uniref:Uncharacterized protein n=1 Tax=Aegilops tauschii TaxID=37682 RepID=M8AZ03_AEGTA
MLVSQFIPLMGLMGPILASCLVRLVQFVEEPHSVLRGEVDSALPNPQGTHTSDNEDIDRAIALSLSEEGQRKGKAIDTDDHLEEDEELARALQESLKDKHPLRQKIPAGGVHSDSTPATSLLPDILPSSRSRYLL